MFRIVKPGLDYNLVVVKSYLKLDPRQRPTSPSSFDIGRALNFLIKKVTPLPLRTTSREILPTLLVLKGMI